jgi:hypothetical protein
MRKFVYLAVTRKWIAKISQDEGIRLSRKKRNVVQDLSLRFVPQFFSLENTHTGL